MKPSDIILRLLLAIAGIAVVLLGINIGFGGIRTLGWQGAGDFLTVTNPEQFAIHDNHIRFIGGVWLGLGLMLVAGSLFLRQMASVLVALMVMIFIGGLARLSAADPAILTNAAILPSFVLELVVFPLLGWWVWRVRWFSIDRRGSR